MEICKAKDSELSHGKNSSNLIGSQIIPNTSFHLNMLRNFETGIHSRLCVHLTNFAHLLHKDE
jgi:hypothetical protein